MKKLIKHIAFLSFTALIFSGCYTQVKLVEYPERPTNYATDEYEAGYWDGVDETLYQFRDFNRARWSAHLGYHYNPRFYGHYYHDYYFFYGHSFHYPFYSHYSYFYDPYFGYGFHYHRYPHYFGHRHHWYGHYRRPYIVYNNYYAQAKPRPQTVRGSGVNRGSSGLASGNRPSTRVDERRPNSRTVIPGSTPITRTPSGSATIRRTAPPPSRGSSGTVNRPTTRGTNSGSSSDRPQTRQGSSNSGSSGSVNRGSSNRGSSGGSQTRGSGNNRGSGDSGNRPRSRDQSFHIPAIQTGMTIYYAETETAV